MQSKRDRNMCENNIAQIFIPDYVFPTDVTPNIKQELQADVLSSMEYEEVEIHDHDVSLVKQEWEEAPEQLGLGGAGAGGRRDRPRRECSSRARARRGRDPPPPPTRTSGSQATRRAALKTSHTRSSSLLSSSLRHLTRQQLIQRANQKILLIGELLRQELLMHLQRELDGGGDDHDDDDYGDDDE